MIFLFGVPFSPISLTHQLPKDKMSKKEVISFECIGMGCLYIRPGMSSLCANLILSALVWCNGYCACSWNRGSGVQSPVDTSLSKAH